MEYQVALPHDRRALGCEEMEVLAKVFLPPSLGGTQRFVKLKIDGQTTNPVRALKAQLAESTNQNADFIEVFFCGRVLNETTELNQLLLSPQTYLTVIVKDKTDNAEASLRAEKFPESTAEKQGSFYIYCKPCEAPGTAKLRLYCAECNGLSIVLLSEPQSWDDILAGKLHAECKDCGMTTRARAEFKCATCSEVSPPLRHLKKNRSDEDCVICGTVDSTVVSMNCAHAACVPCFTAYVEQALLQWNFLYKPSVGYTVSCPFFGCPGFMRDTHHLYVLGTNNYKAFQRKATEKYVSLNEERQYCPYPKCGAMFLLEPDGNTSDEAAILCPECGRIYCKHCRHHDCQCDDQNEISSRAVMRSISKPCPKCQAPTERSGGCAHIKCTACHYEWCFVCQKPWSDGCQWDHWLI